LDDITQFTRTEVKTCL